MALGALDRGVIGFPLRSKVTPINVIRRETPGNSEVFSELWALVQSIFVSSNGMECTKLFRRFTFHQEINDTHRSGQDLVTLDTYNHTSTKEHIRCVSRNLN